MKTLILLSLTLLSSPAFAWFDQACVPLTIDNTCIVVCYINANLATTKLHDGECQTLTKSKIDKDDN